MRISPRRHIICVHMAIVMAFYGCLSSNTVSPGVDRGEEVRESVAAGEELFQWVRQFYCNFDSWPTSWDELDASLRYDQKASALNGIEVVEMDSPRAIVLRVAFRDSSGGVVRSVFIAPPTCGEDLSREDSAANVSMAGGRMRFMLPPDLHLMSGEDIKKRWNKPPRPDSGWSNDEGLTVAIRFGELDVDQDSVVALLDTLSIAYEQAIPSIQWIDRWKNTIGDRSFLYHEFESEGSTGHLVTAVLSTSFDGKLVSITISGSTTTRARVEETVNKIIGEIKIG